MNDLIYCGFNAIHPLEPKAMSRRELKEKLRGKVCLLGGVDLDRLLMRGTTREVEDSVKELVKELAPGGGFGMGSTNSVTKKVPLENYRAMIEAVSEYGKYPIR